MKLLLIAISLICGIVAVSKTVACMHAATAVMDQAVGGAQR